jgi:hypothetical protein
MEINEVLQQYHQKFDDSKVIELLEELEQMMYERATFFKEFPDDDEQLNDKIEDYWYDLDNLAYGSESHDDILNKLRDDVKGVQTCGSCKRISLIKSKLLTSVLTDTSYLGKLCETCYSKKNLVMEYKTKIDKDTVIPSDLTDIEKELMLDYQSGLKIEVTQDV